MARGPQIRSRIRAYFQEHPDQVVRLGDLMTACDTDSEQSIQAAVRRMLLADPSLPIVVESAGQAWTYHTKTVKVSKRRYTEVVTTGKGRVIVEDEDGKLFVLKELDLS